MLMNQLIAQLVRQGRQWVAQQRMAYRNQGQELSPEAVAEFSRYFDRELLREVRTVTVPAIDNPGFIDQYRTLFTLFRVPLLDFSSMAAITFVDTILLVEGAVERDLEPLIFHELVHVVQYAILGLDRFVEQFINGWVNQGFNYAAIPLEMDAYELQNRFETEIGEAFRVREEVAQRLELMLED
jgi:hypothetical protein